MEDIRRSVQFMEDVLECLIRTNSVPSAVGRTYQTARMVDSLSRSVRSPFSPRLNGRAGTPRVVLVVPTRKDAETLGKDHHIGALSINDVMHNWEAEIERRVYVWDHRALVHELGLVRNALRDCMRLVDADDELPSPE